MKSKLKILCWCCAILLLWNCSDDDDPTSFHEEVNWFEIKDNPNDALDHLIYQIYQETGIPIFYNDTLGSEAKGADTFGKPFIRYEILNLTYELTNDRNKGEIRYGLPKSREDIRLGVEVVQKVIKELPGKMHIHSFLLTDSLRKDDGAPWSTPEYLNVYKGLQTVAIGKMDKIGEMSPAEKEAFVEDIGAELLSIYIEKSGSVDDFFAISNKFSEWGSVYDDWVMNKKKEECGFLSVQREMAGSFFAPTEKQDLKDYILAVKQQSEEEFRQLYEAYPPMIEKYNFIKSFIDKLK